MNPRLDALQPYPFERLRTLVDGVTPAPLSPIRLSIGEPQHATPPFIRDALAQHLAGLSVYPTTAGTDRLRQAIAGWFVRRYGLARLDPAQVLPVNGSREGLFAFAQCVIDASRPDPLVGCPNPFYQIYEGAALLAGARPVFLNQTVGNGYALPLDALPPDVWARVQLIYVCSPGNPSGRVLRLDEWHALFEHADRYGFVIASDECYSEIYFDETAPPMGALEAARVLGRDGYRNLVVFTSLSKRSNVPGLRSGAVAGDARLLQQFLRYRTYHGCAMSLSVQEASIVAWNDETHVRENRALYREKFEKVVPLLAPVVDVVKPEAGFYLWMPVPSSRVQKDPAYVGPRSGGSNVGTRGGGFNIGTRSGGSSDPAGPEVWNGDDERFARDLVARANVSVLPGRYLARDADGVNPGAGRVRVALVATLDECVEAARRIVSACD